MILETIGQQLKTMRGVGTDEMMSAASRMGLDHASERLAVCKGDGAVELSDYVELAGALNDVKMYGASIQVYLMVLDSFRITSRERRMISELIGVVLHSLVDESVVDREDAVMEYCYLARLAPKHEQHAWLMGVGIMLMLQQSPAIEKAAVLFDTVRRMIETVGDKEEWEAELGFWEQYVVCMRGCSVGLEMCKCKYDDM